VGITIPAATWRARHRVDADAQLPNTAWSGARVEGQSAAPSIVENACMCFIINAAGCIEIGGVLQQQKVAL